jgi:predicted GIY-YIG superfamily endonuclease
MPKENIDYSNTIIYKIYCNDDSIRDIYVGHTTDLIKRRSMHKYTCNNENVKQHNLKIYVKFAILIKKIKKVKLQYY